MSPKSPTLGTLLRGLRTRQGWTLKEMSEHTDIPLSTLSKIEHDRLTLTYDKLQHLSQRLNLRMSELFCEPETDTAPKPVTARRSLGTLDKALRIKTDNYDYFYLCTELRRKRMIPIITKVRAKTTAEFGELVRHPGEEYVHVIEGRIQVHTEFYDPVVLETGEGIYIDSQMGHAYIVDGGCEEAVLLAVCASADEDLMESLITLHEHEVSV
ncbi:MULTISPECIES: XRE family transcriptional regulator [unclassified Stenotrophomonas]|uniref:helix-turn-helix domain-containing protein n=1 Tax=unclassified Stenotrophomonas TaxID=196198 RepID=UPI002119846A|nr:MULTISPECIES: XRE family transcriptional regulator [unclassified Stenotrophomonas]